ncbi:MAG TPA: acetylxylan esterase [Pirellulales bacterium]|nr:acetylxylan esterase [Pirellulales bacterium]
MLRLMSTIRSFIVASSILSTAVLVMTILAATARADFPDVEQLPERSTLPDPLAMFDGTPVRTAAEWRERRRPELIKLFEWYMYGAAPAAPQVEASTDSVDEVLDGKARMKQVTITFGPSAEKRAGRINLLLFVPAGKKQPAPVFLGLNFRGNHMVLAHPAIHLPRLWMPSGPGMVDNRATEAGRGLEAPHWPLEKVIERGYAVATFYHGDIKLDKPTWDDGTPSLYFQPGQTAPAEHEWGTIAAWAWGLSRAVDYLSTDPDIDARRIAVFGHSRNGKTALLAGALDERIALVIPSQAGCGGTSPSRGTVGESVERINTVFPHWFDGTFKKFNKATSKLPFDQHCLMALVAPRPLLLTNATGDQWANPTGQFEMLKAAEPVFKLLGTEGCGAAEMPPENELVNTHLGYFIRPGKHDMSPVEWAQWLDFADKHLPK